MAANIKDKVVPIGSAKKGPKPGAGRKLAEAAASAAKADEIMGLPPKAAAPVDADTDIASQDTDLRTAPAFGANEPDVGVFLKHVNILSNHEEKLEAWKLDGKNLKKQKRSLRADAIAAGIIMGELDRALEDANTDQVDLDAREQRYLLYMEWLGKPINHQGQLPGLPVPTDTERTAMRWFNRGDVDGRMGRVRKAPEGCTGVDLQNYLKGWENGQRLLMQGSPLTAGAFNADGTPKTAAELKPMADDDGKMVTFTEAHFGAGTELDDANLKTLLPGHKEAFHNVENVIAVFGDKKRVLKEPDIASPGGFYIDTGEDDAPVSAPEPVASSAAEFS